MGMSGLFAVVVLILAGFTLRGYIKGMIRVVFSLVSIFLTIGLVTWMTPFVSEFLETKTPVYRTIQEKCVERVQIKAKTDMNQEVEEQEPINIAGIEIPEEWQKSLTQKTTDVADEFLTESGVYESMGNYIAGIIVNGIACVLSFIIVVLVLRILVNMLDIVAKLPVLRSMNHLGGTIAGALQGIVIVWILFFVITLCQTSDFGQGLLKDINNNLFLKVLYENNGIEYIMMRVIL